MVVKTMGRTWTQREGRSHFESWADAEVEIVGEQSRSQGQAATTKVTDRKATGATGTSAGDGATEKRGREAAIV